MGSAIQNLFYLRQRLLIGAQVVLISYLRVGDVAQELANHFSLEPTLQPSSRGGSTQATKPNAIGTTSKTGILAGRRKRILDFRHTEHSRLIGIAMLMQPGKFNKQSIADRQSPASKCLGIQRGESDAALFKIDVLPSQTKDLAFAHSGIQSADDDRFDVLPLPAAGVEQSVFFIQGKHASAPRFVGAGDQRVATVKRTASDPSFTFCDVKDPTRQGELAVDAGNATQTDRLSALISHTQSGRAFSFPLVGFKIRVANAADGGLAEISEQGLGIRGDGFKRAKPADFPITAIGGDGDIALEIPCQQGREFRLRVELPADGQRLAFFQSFAQSVAGLGFGFTGAPDSLPLAVDDVGNDRVEEDLILLAGAFLAALNDADLVWSGHGDLFDLYFSLYLRRFSGLAQGVGKWEFTAQQAKKPNKRHVLFLQSVTGKRGVRHTSRFTTKRLSSDIAEKAEQFSNNPKSNEAHLYFHLDFRRDRGLCFRVS